MAAKPAGSQYEAEISPQQELTFKDEERARALGNVNLGEQYNKAVFITDEDDEYTNLGLLVSDQCHHTIRISVFGGPENRFEEGVELTGSLFKQYKDCLNFMERINKTQTHTQGSFKVEEKDFPELAYKEAVQNAILHRDYTFDDSTLINIYDDRMEIINIGGIRDGVTVEDLRLGMSVARNRRLMDLFYRLGLVDAFGVGITNMYAVYKSKDLQPTLEFTDKGFKVILPNANYHQVDESLPKSEQTVMQLFKEKQEIRRTDVEEALSIAQTMAGRILRRMEENGLIESLGAGKTTRYIKKK